jgi:hypothetical protein
MATSRLFRRYHRCAVSLSAVLFSGVVGCASPVIAQTSDSAFPAAMYRSAVEAAQSQSNEYGYFVAVGKEFPHQVLAIHRERAQADAVAGRTKVGYGVIGPILGGQPMAMMSILLPCRHRAPSYITCPDTTMSFSKQSVERILIVYQGAGGSDTVMRFVPDSGDAVFFTPSAMEKFVFPYYERVFGMERANQMREEYIRRARRP